MKLLLSSVLLASLCSPSSWSVSSLKLVVTQSPDVSVAEGGAVSITCCWTGDYGKMRVQWLKNQTVIKNQTLESTAQTATDCSNLTFIKVTREDSGRYTCRVTQEIPYFYAVNGSGTVITVRATEDTKDTKDTEDTEDGATGDAGPLPLPVIISLAVAAPLLLITLVCLCALRRRQVSAQAARVIYEVPYTDSEEADMDKHSTSSSRGSSQWCQVPVYESFDYFERAEAKESG